MKRIQVLALGTVLCLALAGIAMASQAEVYTVGDFAVNLAKMVTNKADYSTEEASALMEKLGVNLKGDLNAQVDEELFVEALNRFGLKLTTSNPDREITGQNADRVFAMFDRKDSAFTGEVFKTCQQGDGEPHQCYTDADCVPGHECKVVASIQCKGGANDGDLCMTNGDCPGGTCKIPPGQFKKLDTASPSD